jgi:hypothetical protein
MLDKSRILIEVVLSLAALLCLSVFLWILIAATHLFFLPGMPLHAPERLRRRVVGISTSIRSLGNPRGTIIVWHKVQDQSIEQHDLWDRWLDG